MTISKVCNLLDAAQQNTYSKQKYKDREHPSLFLTYRISSIIQIRTPNQIIGINSIAEAEQLLFINTIVNYTSSQQNTGCLFV